MLIENDGGEQTVATNAQTDYQETFKRQLVKGMDKYGVVLKTFNGRDPGRDAFEELVDLSVYLEQLRMERKAFAEILWYALNKCSDMPILPQKIFETLCNQVDLTVEEITQKWGLHA